MYPLIKRLMPPLKVCAAPRWGGQGDLIHRFWFFLGMLLWLYMALLSVPAVAADIEVLALFRDQAVINVDGRRHKLKVGESTAEGVRLVSADTGGVMLEIDGVSRRYPLGAKLRTGYQSPAAASEVHIYRDPQGMFSTVGSINGLTVDFLVDTGATSVAMNSAQARRLGVDYRVQGEPGEVETASGRASAYHVMLKTVQVGAIRLDNIEAVVLEGDHPVEILLGMSFLGRLKIDNTGEQMILQKKF